MILQVGGNTQEKEILEQDQLSTNASVEVRSTDPNVALSPDLINLLPIVEEHDAMMRWKAETADKEPWTAVGRFAEK